MAVLVGKEAPDFTAAAVLADGTIIDDYNLLYCFLPVLY